MAAIAAGADAVYAGLKQFSARMQAGNFSVVELARLADLGRERGVKTYLALNTLLKPGDLDAAGRLLDRAARLVRPDAIIVQDLGAVEILRQLDFQGEIHLSTLANCGRASGLAVAKELGAHRVVLPRELTIDEIRAAAAGAPAGLSLEVFVHGALCFCVSGRCWWSGFMGGKSGLRGRCVQPCRRVYAQKNRRGRFFSCQDLSLDLLVKTLLTLPEVRAWKIEGRKKGPHYVYYTTAAYKMLRDCGDDPALRKEALRILEHALGRPSGHYGFLPQKPQSPVMRKDSGRFETGSGLFVGVAVHEPDGRAYVVPRRELIPGDLLRVGYEDDPHHETVKVRRATPKAGRFDLSPPPPKIEGKGRGPVKGRGKPAPQTLAARIPSGTPVFLIDRREPELVQALADLGKAFDRRPPIKAVASSFSPRIEGPERTGKPGKPGLMRVHRRLPPGFKPRGGLVGVWVNPAGDLGAPRSLVREIFWWLAPMIWPGEESATIERLRELRRLGATHFVLNEPWQLGMFPDRAGLTFWAGPFCNLGNGLAFSALKRLGFSAGVAAPELGGEDFLALPKQSPIPVGVVAAGLWPVGLTRIRPETVKTGEPFESPKNERFFAMPRGETLWLYPDRSLDLLEKRPELDAAGTAFFVDLIEHKPKAIPDTVRSTVYNWDVGLL